MGFSPIQIRFLLSSPHPSCDWRFSQGYFKYYLNFFHLLKGAAFLSVLLKSSWFNLVCSGRWTSFTYSVWHSGSPWSERLCLLIVENLQPRSLPVFLLHTLLFSSFWNLLNISQCSSTSEWKQTLELSIFALQSVSSAVLVSILLIIQLCPV